MNHSAPTRWPVSLLGLVLVLVGCGPRTGVYTGINALTPAQSQEVDQLVHTFMPQHDYLNVAVVRGDEILLTRCYGRDRLNKTDVYGSVSKPVTSMIVMQLLESGRIQSLDDPIHRYDPDYADVLPEAYAETPITFRHLLSHRSGVRHLSDMWDGDRLNLAFEPGTDFSYSTQGYGIVGEVLEEMTGVRYGELVRTRIGDPMGATSFGARRHFNAPGAHVRSTIHDMALFAAGVMHEAYVPDTVLHEVVFPGHGTVPVGKVGLGWFCTAIGTPDMVVFHHGLNGDRRAYLRLKPFKHIAIAMTGKNKSRGGAVDLPQLGTRLLDLLEASFQSPDG